MASKQTRRRSMMTAISHMFNSSSGQGGESGTSPPSSSSTSKVRRPSEDGTHGPPSDLERCRSATSERKAERESDLSQQSQDLLFYYQLEQPDPRRLGPEAFHAAGIALNRAVSARIYATLQRHNIISSHLDDYKIYADRITRQLPGQLPMLSPSDLHRMVGLLFWWEQEQVRWNLIEAQIRDEKAGFERREGHGAVAPPSSSSSPTYTSSATVPSSLPLSSSSSPPLPHLPPIDDVFDSASVPVVAGDSHVPEVPEDGNDDEGEEAENHLPTGLQRMSSDYEQHARLEQHKLALAHLENSKKLLPSLRERLSSPEGEDGGEINRATKPPAYGDFHNSVPVMGSPSREDVSLIDGVTRQRSGPESESRGTQGTLEPRAALPTAAIVGDRKD